MIPFCPNLSNSEVEIDFSKLILDVGENKAYGLWNKHEGNIREIKSEAPTYFLNKDYLSSLGENNIWHSVDTLNKVGNFLSEAGIDTRLVDSVKNEMGETVKDALAVANFIDMTVDVVDQEDRLDAWNALPEEAAHFWYRLLKDTELKRQLWDIVQDKDNPVLQRILKRYNVKTQKDFETAQEEAIGQIIANKIAQIDGGRPDPLFVQWFREFIKWIRTITGAYTAKEDDPIYIAAQKILLSDMSDLLSADEYRILHNLSMASGTVPVENYEPGPLSESARDIVFQASTIEQSNAYFNYLTNKRFKRKTRYLKRTIETIVEANAVGKQDGIKILQKKKLTDEQLQTLADNNKYVVEVPTLRSFEKLLERYPNKVDLNSNLKFDGVSKHELVILNDIKDKIKTENPKLKGIPTHAFINEVNVFLEAQYSLGFAYEQSHLEYRVLSTFDAPTRHEKISIRFNNEYFDKYSHFQYSPTAWGNLTPFDYEFPGEIIEGSDAEFLPEENQWEPEHPAVIKKQSLGKPQAVLLHEIQNDFFEDLKEVKRKLGEAKTSDPDFISLDREYIEKYVFGGDPLFSKWLKHFYKNENLKTDKDGNALSENAWVTFKEALQENRDLIGTSNPQEDVLAASALLDGRYASREYFKILLERHKGVNGIWKHYFEPLLEGTSGLLFKDIFDAYYGSKKDDSVAEEFYKGEYDVSPMLWEAFVDKARIKMFKDYWGGTVPKSMFSAGLRSGLKTLTEPIFNNIIPNPETIRKRPVSINQRLTIRYKTQGQKQWVDGLKWAKNNYVSALKKQNKHDRTMKLSELSVNQVSEIYANLKANWLMLYKGVFDATTSASKEDLQRRAEAHERSAKKFERDMNYFTPLVHHLLQTHIEKYGVDTPLIFSGKEITLLTQGSEATANIYAGPEEVKLGMAKKIGPLWKAMSKVKGIKLKYQENIPGFKNPAQTMLEDPSTGKLSGGKTGGYVVDLSNYKYKKNAPFLFSLKAEKEDVTSYSVLKSTVGDTVADYLIDKHNGDFKAIQAELSQSGTRLSPIPKVPQMGLKTLPTGMSRSTLASDAFKLNMNEEEKGVDDNNQAIWDLETQLNLVSIRTIGKTKWKFYNPMSVDEANTIKDWIMQNHLNVKVGFVNPWGDEQSTIGIRILGNPKNVDKELAEHKRALEDGARKARGIINEETREDLLPDPKTAPVEDDTNHEQELKDIRSITNKLKNENHTTEKVLGLINKETDFDERTKPVLDVLRDHATANPGLRFSVVKKVHSNPGMEAHLGYYDPNENVIALIDENIHNPKNADYSDFVTTILHEYIHSFTSKAINDPKTKEEFAFKKVLESLWKTAKRNTKNPKLHGYDTVKEFIADIMSDYGFVEDVKALPYNIWQRFVSAVAKFFGLTPFIDTDISIDENAYKRILEFIPTTKDFATEGDPSPKRTRDDAVNDANYPLRGSIDLSNRKEAEKLLRGIQNDYESVKGEGTVHKKTGWTMFPVTKITSQYNLGVDQSELKKNQTLKEAVERGGFVGDITHGNIERAIDGSAYKAAKDNPFRGSPGLTANTAAIAEKFKGQKVTVISELYIADQQKGIGGKIDLVVIDEKGAVHLYDFKTKEAGFKNWSKRYPNSYDGSLKYSSRQAAHAQLTIYKKIFEKVTGLPVTSLSAVLIQPTVNENNQITGAKLAEEFSGGIDTFTSTSNVGTRIYRSVMNIGARENKFDDFLQTFPGLEDETRSYYVESKLKDIKYQALSFSKTETALNNLIKGLEEQVRAARKTGSMNRLEKLEARLEDVKTQEDSMQSLQILLQTALDDTSGINRRYAEMKKGGENISIGQLLSWKRSVEAWDGFGDYANYLADKIATSKTLEDNPEQKVFFEKLSERIDLVVKRSKTIKSRYTNEGIEKLIDFLAPFYNRLRAERKNELIIAYKKKPAIAKNLTEEEFVRKGLDASKDSITQRTRDLLEEEIRRASTDVSVLGIWLDNLLDSRDPITAAMVKAFAKTEDVSHKQAITVRDRMLVGVRAFEKTNTDRGGVVSYQQLYDNFLEKDENGKPTGHFVNRFNSSLFREYDEEGKLSGGYIKVIADTRHMDPEKTYEYELNGVKIKGTKDGIRRGWKNVFTTFNKEGFSADKWVFINSLMENQSIKGVTIEDIHLEEIRGNERDNKQAFFTGEETESLQDLANIGAIPQELADAIDDWIYKNAWNYRDIRPQFKKKYENSDYQKLVDKGGAEYELFKLLIELTDEADRMLPYSSRLGGRLPGVEKRSSEMLKDGMGILSTVKHSLKSTFTVRPDDLEHDNFEHNDEEKAFLPIHYTGKVDLELQSYDLPTIVFKYWQSANDFSLKKEILPQMEMAKYIINTRKVDNIKAARWNILKPKNNDEVKANNNNLSRQVEEWFQMAVYGRPKKKQGKLFGIDTVKFADALNKYTSLNLLGLNVIQGSANAILGEVLQTAERIAGEYMSPSAYRKGTLFYAKNLPGVMGDVGRRGAQNVVTKLMETFDVLDEWEGTNFSRRQKYRHAMKSDTLFFTTHAGEHEMQGRFLLSMLSDKRAYDKDGKDIGSMLTKYSVGEFGELVLDKEVHLEKSDWTEDQQFEFQYKVRGILSRLHGEYSDLGRMAIQRGALGRMAAMFRKFIIPGFKRRWANRGYVERLDDFVEGNYITTGRFAANMMKDLYHFKFSMASQWGELNDHEKANVRRTLTEVSFLVMAIILSNFAIAKLKEDDDEDERFWSFMSYQALRLRAELLFFIKPDETLSILRSPMASMSVAENIIKLSGQMFNARDVYSRGPWKGQPKIKKTMTNMVPGYRQFYRVRDLRDQLSWFSSKIN